MSKQHISGHCPICQRPADEKFRPFCSKSCADIDLGHWLTESYAIPAVENEDDAEEGPTETVQ